VSTLGCIVPLGPEFENPPAAPNYYPYFSNIDPTPQTVRNLPPVDALEFHVDVGDQNPEDTLYVRWVSDYPPYTQGVSKILIDGDDGVGKPIPPSRTEIRPPINFNTRCQEFVPGMEHTLAVIVSDRPFRPASQPFNGDPLRYNLVGTAAGGAPVTTFVLMTGWTIQGCQP
jgi:hypothetical protein